MTQSGAALFPVVSEKTALATVVIEADARDVVTNAAEVLRQYVYESTGVRLDLVKVTEQDRIPANAIVVGDAGIAMRAGVNVSALNLKYDGFVVQHKSGRLVLSGVYERGPLYAVIDFLEREVGCHWLSGSRIIVPKRDSLTAEVVDRHESPAFEIRMPWGISMWPPASRTTSDRRPGWGRDPFRSDEMAHTFFVDAPVDTYFGTHPEWFAYHRGPGGGLRFSASGQFSYHDTELARHVANVKLEAFRGWASDRPNLWLSQNDKLGWSEDPVTVEFDRKECSTAASHVHFVNKVADAVAAEFPDRRIITLAYLHTHIPPRTLKYSPNVTLLICEPDSLWLRSVTQSGPLGRQYLDTIRRWSEKTTLPLVWIYHMSPETRYRFTPDVAGLQDDFKAYRKAGAKGYFAELYSADYGTTYFDDLRAYLMSRLAWDPDIDMKSVLRQFHLLYFGPKSGPVMLDFYHATVNGMNTYEPQAWSDARLDRMEAILKRAEPLADDDFARREILKARRAVIHMRLSKLVTGLKVSEGRLHNAADSQQARELREQFNELQTLLGDTDKLTEEQQAYSKPAVQISSSQLNLTLVPEAGGAITQIVDRETGEDAAFLLPLDPGGLVGGYQEIYGFVWGDPGVYLPFTVRSQTGRSIVLQSDKLQDGMVVTRRVSLAADRPRFTILTTLRNTGTETITRVIRTHPMLRNGAIEDNYFIYRNDAGKFFAKPVPVLEAFSAGWGPTGLWAIVNPKTNRGILWESSDIHNGSFVWASPFHGSFFCNELFSPHAAIAPGKTLQFEQHFTILRDVRKWCEQHGIDLSSASKQKRGC